MDTPMTPKEVHQDYLEYLRLRGLHPEQVAARKAKQRARGKAARKARKANR